MCPERCLLKVDRSQRGSALMVAIFALVVMAALGAALVRMMESQQTRVVSEVLSLRALTLARAGAERRLVDLFPLGGGVVHCDGTPDSDALADGSSYSSAPLLLDLSGLPASSSCQPVAVSCSSVHVGGVAVIRLRSSASCGTSGDDAVQVSRAVELEARAP